MFDCVCLHLFRRGNNLRRKSSCSGCSYIDVVDSASSSGSEVDLVSNENLDDLIWKLISLHFLEVSRCVCEGEEEVRYDCQKESAPSYFS